MSSVRKASQKVKGRYYRKMRVRDKINGTPARPRLSIFRSAKHIYAQLIDDVNRITLAAASTRDKDLATKNINANLAGAKEVGSLVATRAKQKGIESVVFDRNGYRYHGKLKALAEAAREGGLKF